MEWIVAISLIAVFTLVIITGLLSYQRLDGIMDTVKKGIMPDRKLVLVKDIMNDLSEAESNVKSYTLTLEAKYMVSFYEIAAAVGDKIGEYRALWPDDRRMARYLDTLDRLVEEKFFILNQVLFIQDEFRVQQAMEAVMDNIGQTEPGAAIALPDTVIVVEPVKKENFFSRIFKRKETAGVPLNPGVTSTVPDTVLPMEAMGKRVEWLGEQASLGEKELRLKEMELLQQNQVVMDRIRAMIHVLEQQGAESLAHETGQAERKAGEVRAIIMAFGLASSLLLILTALVIYRYIRKNEEYKTVLNKAREDALELAGAKELFLANMSHEIRTPMNIISGFLDQVLQGRLEDDQQEKLAIVKRSSDHLLRLLNDLLDLSRLQAGRLELFESGFSPAALAMEVCQSLKPSADIKNLTLLASADPALPVTLIGDEARVRQILFNLAGNAIKFTGAGTVSVHAGMVSGNDRTVTVAFEVKDTGIGMQPDELKRVFENFEQVKAGPGKKNEGAGLGLSITRQLVNLMGGSIQVESRSGHGSSFRVELPFGKVNVQSPPATASSQKEKSVLSGSVILVADDEEYNRKLARVILEKHGCQVVEAVSGNEAVVVVESQPVDLVLMDVRMPGMNGPEAAARINDICITRGIYLPVIAVSAAINAGDVISWRKSGIGDVLLKPVTEEELIKKVSDHLARPWASLDLEPLRLSCAGNVDFFREMIRLFIKDTEAGLEMISKAMQNGDWGNVSAMAHKISSPCRHLKAERLHSLLKKIEIAADDAAEPQAAEDALEQARTEFKLIRELIYSQTDIKK